jgi:hypothetical protein
MVDGIVPVSKLEFRYAVLNFVSAPTVEEMVPIRLLVSK